MPGGQGDHPLVIKAAKGGFNINGVENGVRLAADHSWAGHPAYNSAVREALDAYESLNPNLTSSQAAELLTTLANTMREHLKAVPLPIR